LCADAGEVTAPLGPEPLDPGFTPAEFHRRLVSRRRQIKPLLLDQAFLSGLGNIYTDEALFLAGLHPASLSDRLSPQDSERLLGSIRQVLNEGIDANGASLDWVYRGGDFQNRFRVYQRTGQACFNCGRPIERILIGQRSTHFCLNCQTLLD
jgi:formamidopyrimidine-DNA glycosylase